MSKGIIMKNCSDIKLENCIMRGFDVAIEIENCWNIEAKNNKFSSRVPYELSNAILSDIKEEKTLKDIKSKFEDRLKGYGIFVNKTIDRTLKGVALYKLFFG